MNGWDTQHQEFSPAKGDAAVIKHLISTFYLQEIISFDELNSLITTTIQHNRYIRLSDLISLNVFCLNKQKSQVIFVTLSQYLEIIRQLFELLQIMKQWQIQHGNLQSENVLLDLGNGIQKLDFKPNPNLVFQVKLINFAQFSNKQMLDDNQQSIIIQKEILSNFPSIQHNLLNKTNMIELQSEIVRILNQHQHYRYSSISWNPEIILNFQASYMQIKINNTKVMDIIKDLHVYYLITHHFLYLQPKQSFDYLNEPGNIQQACKSVDYLTTIELDLEGLSKLLSFQKLVNGKQSRDLLYKVKTAVQSNIVIYLKQQGYFQDIFKLVQITNQGEANQYRSQLIEQQYKNIIDELIQNADLRGDFQLLNDVELRYIQSTKMFKNMIQTSTLINIKSFKSYNHFKIIFDQMHRSLIEQLKKIKELGEKYSKLLIDHCINEKIGKELKGKHLKNMHETLIIFMINQWIKWIDQYIVDNKFSKVEQLSEINKSIFIKFIQQQGFTRLKEELKKQICAEVKEIFLKLI